MGKLVARPQPWNPYTYGPQKCVALNRWTVAVFLGCCRERPSSVLEIRMGVDASHGCVYPRSNTVRVLQSLRRDGFVNCTFGPGDTDDSKWTITAAGKDELRRRGERPVNKETP